MVIKVHIFLTILDLLMLIPIVILWDRQESELSKNTFIVLWLVTSFIPIYNVLVFSQGIVKLVEIASYIKEEKDGFYDD